MKARALGQPATDEEKAEAARKVEAEHREQELRDAEARELCAAAKDGEKKLSDGWHSAACKDGKVNYLSSSGGYLTHTVGTIEFTKTAECFR
jgi:hypothetical protein